VRAPSGLRTKSWEQFAFDTNPGDTNITPFPAALTRWKCHGIYPLDDAQVGLWSAEASITIGG
jgi:hypothetical protein